MTKNTTRAYAGINAIERQKIRRQQFIEAGLRLFGNQGYSATTMRSLCSEAGLTNRYFYESFASIEELLIACYQQLIEQHRENLDRAIAQANDDLASKFKAGLTCFMQAMQDPIFARITQIEVIGISQRVDAVYAKAMRDFSQVGFKLMCQYGLDQGRASRELELTSYALVGAMVMTAGMWMRSGYKDSLETVSQATLTLLLGTVKQLAEPTIDSAH